MALKRRVLRPATQHLKRQKSSLQKKQTDKEHQVTRFLQDLSPDECRLFEEASQATRTENDPTETSPVDEEDEEEQETLEETWRRYTDKLAAIC